MYLSSDFFVAIRLVYQRRGEFLLLRPQSGNFTARNFKR